MASAQVLPNSMASSRKLEHLEAGKRRLEEFRKKKAAERVKKAVGSSYIPDGVSHENQSLESEHAQRIADSDGATTTKSSSLVVVNNDRPADSSFQNIDQDSSNERHARYQFSRNEDGVLSADPVKSQSNEKESKTFNGLRFSGSSDVNSRHEILELNKDSGIYNGSQARIPSGTAFDVPFGISPQSSEETGRTFSQSSLNGVDGVQHRRDSSQSEKSSVLSSGHLYNISPPNSVGTLQHSDPSTTSLLASGRTFSSSYDGFFNSTNRNGIDSHEVRENMHSASEIIDNQTSDFGQKKLIDAPGFTRFLQPSESASLNTDIISNYEPMYTASSDNSFRRSRPSFLDSLTVTRAPSGGFLGHSEPFKESRLSDGFKADEENATGSFSFQNPTISDEFKTDGHDGSESFSFRKPENSNMKTAGTSSDFASQNTQPPYSDSLPYSVFGVKGPDKLSTGIYEETIERKHDLYSSKQNEDFAALEQHIEDLTQEKFSLQRAMEASRALAESLATENSSLTDSYNHQRNIVNQLKSDMEMLQEQMKAQMVELESIKLEYGNAQLECNAADERAKLIASEVIGLEEKALRLRSNELKLERQLENLEAEISSYKRKMSIMERERQDFQSTIDALQEEKKLLQSKLWKTSTSGKSIDINKFSNRKDMSTSTADLVNTDTSPGSSNHEIQDVASLHEVDSSGLPMLLENANVEVSSVDIPPDHMRMIQNINALIAELAVEKEELTQALTSELASSSRLKELNKELSRKLEAQTQRLELLTAQSMAGEIIPARQPDSHAVHEDVVLADEGDEVVERVLGWIMKLFPGGPSHRRTSKLL